MLFRSRGGPIPANIASFFPDPFKADTWNLAGLSAIPGLVQSYQLGIGKFPNAYGQPKFAGWYQDDWRLTNKLTLNLGVRYDIQLIPQPTQPNTLTPLTTLYTSTINIDKNNFAPRLGLAWNLAKGTVLRAGYEIGRAHV